MRLAIIAATGGIGGNLLAQAVAAGHQVTAVVRDPSRLPAGVPATKVDLAAPDPAALREALAGTDAVLSGLGPHSRGGRDCRRGHPSDRGRDAGNRNPAHRGGQRRTGGDRRRTGPPAPPTARPR